MTIFFTADQHFGHWTNEQKNIIRYCDRPFANIDEHDEALIDRWNAVVRPGDRVYDVGDMVFGGKKRAEKYLSRLNGNIYLVRGNHDRWARNIKNSEIRNLVWARDLFTVKIGNGSNKLTIMLCHFPMLSWDGMYHGGWMLHGHSHGKLTDDMRYRRMDVGVDVWDYAPVALEELQVHMARRGSEFVGYRDEQ